MEGSVFVFAEVKAIARFIWRSPHHLIFIHWLDQLDRVGRWRRGASLLLML